MTAVEEAPATERYAAFRDALFADGLLIPTGVDGVYLRSALFESVVVGIDAMVHGAGQDQSATELHFPPVAPRTILERSDYVRSFPDLMGVVSSFRGGDREHASLLATLDRGEAWADQLTPTDLALCSAACHPLYGTIASPVPAAGRNWEIHGSCFRHEPSVDPARMQAFRQHEFVYVGDEAGARHHRDVWVERSLDLLGSLELDVRPDVANDPFFGRSGQLLAASQRADALKIEALCAICSEEAPTAIASSNCHLDHFGVAYGIALDDGTVAHSACVGFGLERIALALLHTHGLDIRRWPAPVRRRLGL